MTQHQTHLHWYTLLHTPHYSINQSTGRMYSRIFIMLVLFGIFFKFFGYVSFQKYLQGGTMIDRKLKYPEELDAPALLVCPINTDNANGFKNLTEEEIYSKTFCKSAKDSEEFFNCFEENTHMFEEVITNAMDSKNISLRDESLWPVSFVFLLLGRCYMQKLHVGAIGYTGKFFHLSINSSLASYVALFDPKFYVMTNNLKVVPRIFLTLNKNCGNKTYYIDVVEHIKLNDKKYPCMESYDYSFTECIKTKTMEKVGCRLKWEKSSGYDLPLCNKEQFFRYGEEHDKYFKMEQSELVNYTQCPLPCSYKEYKGQFQKKNSDIFNQDMV